MAVGIALATSGSACEPDAPPSRLDPELVSALGLEGHEVVRTISLDGDRGSVPVRPPRLEVGPADIVEFVTADRRVHAVAFPPDSLTPAQRRFLESTGQDASPPLIGQGSRFVVTFENAPAGRYPFVSRGHGEEAGGIIIVRPER